MTDVRITQGSGNVFLDLGFPPHEAAVMLLRCDLLVGPCAKAGVSVAVRLAA